MKNRIFVLFIFLLLTACASTPKKPLSPAEQQANLLTAISKGGVRRLEVGDELRLILPNSHFFVNGTARLKVSSYPTLSLLVTLLNQRKNFGIDIMTFTPTPDLQQETSDLAKQQALVIEDYLLDHGLNTRIIVARAWDRQDQSEERGVRFDGDQPQILSTEIRTRHLLPEDSE
ncbi:OmpA family protein [Rickettsiella endosymbiont of Miltochrista miniata]|uniref:OmpA family protein n=1 Tax=Rickettsiella endosymbiont of Miltochrista miniata TaxID=3066239 RepID=UPI00313C917B